MTWLAAKLQYRARIMAGVQTPAADGSMRRGYATICTVWTGFEELSYGRTMLNWVRSGQQGEVPTHEFLMRRAEVGLVNAPAFRGGFAGSAFRGAFPGGLGRAFTGGFSLGFNREVDINPLKADWFLFLEEGTHATAGRLFKIRGSRDSNQAREYFVIQAREVEEQGTGQRQ